MELSKTTRHKLVKIQDNSCVAFIGFMMLLFAISSYHQISVKVAIPLVLTILFFLLLPVFIGIVLTFDRSVPPDPSLGDKF
jgi:hypothetical protein